MSILSWRRMKKRVERTYSEDFDLPNHLFVRLITEIVDKNPPNGKIQLLIALKNLNMLYKVQKELHAEKGTDYSVRDIIENTEEMLSRYTDEIVVRRIHWFCQSAYILRCIEEQSQHNGFFDAALQCWIYFLRAHEILPNVVRENIIWSDDEKAWFKPIRGAESKTLMLVALLAPDNIASDRRFVEAYRTLNGGIRPLFFRSKHDGSYKTTIN